MLQVPLIMMPISRAHLASFRIWEVLQGERLLHLREGGARSYTPGLDPRSGGGHWPLHRPSDIEHLILLLVSSTPRGTVVNMGSTHLQDTK